MLILLFLANLHGLLLCAETCLLADLGSPQSRFDVAFGIGPMIAREHDRPLGAPERYEMRLGEPGPRLSACCCGPTSSLIRRSVMSRHFWSLISLGNGDLKLPESRPFLRSYLSEENQKVKPVPWAKSA